MGELDALSGHTLREILKLLLKSLKSVIRGRICGLLKDASHVEAWEKLVVLDILFLSRLFS